MEKGLIVHLACLLCLHRGAGATGRITPLLNISNTACIAENLRLTDRYTCDARGNVICLGGWSNPSRLCDIPICNVNNKGCIHGDCIFPNVCACNVGWDGPNCNECIPLSGCRHGSCNGPLECNCKPGWTGGQCNEALCEGCENGCCHEPNKCICDPGWTGSNCTECTTLSNCKNGRCLSRPFQCECFDGWRGSDCDSAVCRETCHPVNGFCNIPGECICHNGWTGRDCWECVPYPGCNGTCVNNVPWTCSDSETPNPGRSDEWSPWGNWSSCSRSCGEGSQRRERICPASVETPMDCFGPNFEARDCNIENCQIDGHWSPWTDWSPCSQSCGTGNKIRRRACSNPTPKFGGDDCVGKESESMKCFMTFCPVDGRWSAWKAWGRCSVSCGDGIRSRSRDCDAPVPLHGGNSCLGDNSQVTACNSIHCPINAIWSNWNQWTPCSKTCGQGQRQRVRNCEEALFGGRPCEGNTTTEIDIIPCWEEIECAIDGNWSEWESWTECSSTCGGGSRARIRRCNNPAPLFNGAHCRGPPSETEQCNVDVNCPIGGTWANWGNWSLCSATCGGGSTRRNRTCIPPEFGGNPCVGISAQDRRCNEFPCGDDGGWSSWSEWSTCSQTCLGGIRSRRRSCNDILSGGCAGPELEEEACNFDTPCQDLGLWSPWTEWSLCSKTCGDGEQFRDRLCTTIGCSGESLERRPCSDGPCELEGTWNDWTEWSVCSATCGPGQTRRFRTCGSPALGLQICVGNAIESKTCLNEACGDGGSSGANWGEWREWEACSVSCGEGFQRRTRPCEDGSGRGYGEGSCTGAGRQTRACLILQCPINGGFSEWGSWSPCTVDCLGDHGDHVRRRHCNNPRPQFGGRVCSGRIKEKYHCTGEIEKQETDPAGKCYHIGA